MNKRATEILAFIRSNPGATGADIMQELEKHSAAAKWFGEGSFWAALFGPGIGSMYNTLYDLEGKGVLRSQWGTATRERGWRRPRHYWVVE